MDQPGKFFKNRVCLPLQWYPQWYNFSQSMQDMPPEEWGGTSNKLY
ncbi:MAG: hypothetical protein ABI480_05385 [Chitinophagaceae bacterium]